MTQSEYGSGAADLKGGLEKALATMAPNRSRHQVVLYLGDGETPTPPSPKPIAWLWATAWTSPTCTSSRCPWV